MPWYFPWSESIKKRACRYLLQHYLGDFLKEKLDLDQLTVDLYNGKGTVSNVLLDVWALNEMLSNAGIPMELVDGFISSISVSVPWKALLNDSCEIEIHGLSLTFTQKHKQEPNLVDSTYSWSSLSMTTSIQLAQECLKQQPSPGEEQAESAQSFEGLEAFAQTIESVLARVRLSFHDTSIRLENIPENSLTGVGVDIKIDRIDYWDLSHEEMGQENIPQRSVYEPVAIAIKNFQIIGFSVFIEEFPQYKRTRLRQLSSEDEYSQETDFEGYEGDSIEGNSFHRMETIPDDLLQNIKILMSTGKQNIKVKLKQDDSLPGPKLDIECSFGALSLMLTPRQLHLLTDTLTSISNESSSVASNENGHHQHSRGRNKMRMMESEDYLKVEESLQQQFHNKKYPSHPASHQDWNHTLESLKSQATLSLASNVTQGSSDEEFFSMTEFPLPALGQPSLINNAVRQHVTENVSYTSTSPRSTLSNVSLGGSTCSLSTKGTLTERASNVFKASSSTGSLATKFSPNLPSPPVHNVGFANIASLDDSLDCTKLKVRASNVIFFLLHRDILPRKSNEERFSHEFSHQEFAENFFNQVAQYSKQPLFGINAKEIQENLSAICNYDHIRVLSSAVTIESEQRNVTGGRSVNIDVILGKLDVTENLYDDMKSQKTNFKIPYSQTKVLEFLGMDVTPSYTGAFSSSQSPCVKVKVHKTSRTSVLTVQSRGAVQPKSSVNIELAQVIVDLDLSMMDRLTSLLYPGPLYKTMSSESQPSSSFMYASLATGRSANHHSAFKQVIADTSVVVDTKTDLVIKCPTGTLHLRIPKPDLRPATVIDKKPWWRKDIFNEYLKLDVSGFEFKSTLASVQTSSTYELLFQSTTGYFVNGKDIYHLINIENTSEEGETGSMGIDMPRILVSSSPPSRSVFEEMDNNGKDSSPDSIEDQYPWIKSDPSPFSTKPSMYGNNEEIISAGSVGEMTAFQEFATASSQFSIDCYFPSVTVNLQSNDVFELVYNRLLGDLVMWEPLAPLPVESSSKMLNPYENVHINLSSHLGNLDSSYLPNNAYGQGPSSDKFFMCRSAIRDAYDSHSTDTSLGDGHDVNKIGRQNLQTKMTVSIHIDEGKLALFPPSKSTEDVDSNEEEVEEPATNNYSHIVLDIKNGRFFLASGFKLQPNTDLIEIYAMQTELYHNNIKHPAVDIHKMEDATSIDFLVPTIYPSESSVRQKFSTKQGTGVDAMLSVAMKCVTHPDGKKKDNLIAISLKGSTMNYRSLPSGHIWLMQLMDFMDIKDYPIQGYSFPKSMTTLHTHLIQCAVDYRPLYLPVHCLLTMESFSLSSNLIPGSSTSILRFVVEDSALHICNKSRLLSSESATFADYVQVVDMGLFELSLKLTDGLDKRQPITDLAMSNNMLYIRTCSDSFVGLTELIKYIALDGDTIKDKPCATDVVLGQVSSNESTVDGQMDETNHIDSLMADAMLDDCETDVSADNDGNNISNMHHPFDGTVIEECLIQSDEDIDDPTSSGEFCFLEKESLPINEMKNDVPSIVKLIDGDINIVADFFQPPIGKLDLLGSPDDYPPPLYRYAIREVSVVWQMYGGNDFERYTPTSSSNSPTETMRGKTRLSKDGKDGRSRRNLLAGGPNRDLDVLMELQLNKIRFMHEIYPSDLRFIYRDVLLIYDLEIRDRLSNSQINKFLYQYSSESLPKQSSANMVVVKFLVTRPDDAARKEEASLKVSLQPLRLNVDQDSLFFLKDFFTEISGSKSHTLDISSPNLPNTVVTSDSHGKELEANSNDSTSFKQTHSVSSDTHHAEKSRDIFIKTFVFSPDVPIRLDYQGKHVNIEQGTLAGLIIGLSQLNCSELRLKKLCNRTGLLGAEKLVNYVVNEWLSDIKTNQLQSILGGVGPTYSFLQLFQGVKDLFWMPVQQYRQDGRIVRGLQKGAHSFSTSTAMAVLELSNRLVSTIQSLAELTYDMVSPGPKHVSSLQTRSSNSTQVVQPAEIREGVANAYAVLSEGLSETATNLVQVATEEHEKKGMSGAVGGVLRQIPPTVVKPLILATEAASNVLGGAMNQLAPDKRREALEKWKNEDT